MKKFLSLLLAVLMCLSVLASCTNTPDGPGTSESKPSESNPESKPGESTPESTPESNPVSSPDEPASSPTEPESSTPDESESDPTGKDESTPDESKPEEPGVEYDLEAAAAYVDSLYKKGNTVTAADYQVVGQVMIAGVKYMVTWSVDNTLVKTVEGSPYWTIDVDEKAKEEHSYKLTATITAGDGTTTTVSYDRTVPKYALTSFEEYIDAPEGTNVVIEGIVVAMNSKSLGNSRNHLFLADLEGKGGYYCYQFDEDPVEKGVKIGMTVAVTSVTAPYGGMQETKGGSFTIVDETIKTVEPLDITDKYAAGESLKNYVGLPVVIKGVTLGSQDLETATSQYLYFELNGVKAYVRSYITDFPTTLTIVKGENGAISSPDKTAIDEDHAAHFGYTADVTGILILYSGAPYLIPMSVTPFTNYKLEEKTPAEKIEAELAELKIDASFNADKVVDLLLKGQYYDDVTFTWATNDETGAAVIADGKLTVKIPDKETSVKVTVTATCGTETATKEFTVKLSKTIITLNDAAAIGAAKEHNTYTEDKYIVAGIIKEVYQTTYGNMYLVDEFGNTFTVYGTYSADGSTRYDKLEKKPQAGDYVVVLGILGQYNGTPQMKNGWILSFTTPITVDSALDMVKDYTKNQYTEDKYVITGEIIEVQNTKYGNVVIKDAASGASILVYGLYSANGAVRYDGMETKPVVGDTITVVGVIGKYDAPQMKNGWLIGYEAGVAEPEVNKPTSSTPATSTTEKGNYVYEIAKSEAALAVDGVLDEAYANGIVLLAERNLPASHTSGKYADNKSTIYVYATADETNIYFFYDVVKDGKTIYWKEDYAKKHHLDCIDFLLSLAGAEAAGTEFRINGAIEGGKGTAFVNGDPTAAGVDNWFVKHTDTGYTVEFSIPLENVTGADANGNKMISFTALSTVTLGWPEGETEPHRVYTCTVKGSTATNEDKANPSFIVVKNADDNTGSTEETKEITVEEALKLEKGTNVVVKGTVVSIDTAWNPDYNNITVTIADDNGNKLQAYRLATLVEKGDIIVVTGVMDEYNGKKQIKAGATAEIVGKVTVEGPQEMTIADALKAADGTAVIVTGTVSNIGTAWDDGYKNMSIEIKDAEGNVLYIYRLATKVGLGDVITVTGDMATYSNARQIAAGATAVIVTAHTCTTFADANCTAPKTCTVCGKTEGAALGHGAANAEGKCPVCGENLSVKVVESSLAIAANKGTLVEKTITWTAEGFTVVGEQAKSSTAIRTSDSDHFRIYQGSTFAIKGEGITKIVLTMTDSKYVTPILNSLTTTGATIESNGTTITVTVTEGTLNEILFTASAQFRVKNIVVTRVEG